MIKVTIGKPRKKERELEILDYPDGQRVIQTVDKDIDTVNVIDKQRFLKRKKFIIEEGEAKEYFKKPKDFMIRSNKLERRKKNG